MGDMIMQQVYQASENATLTLRLLLIIYYKSKENEHLQVECTSLYSGIFHTQYKFPTSSVLVFSNLRIGRAPPALTSAALSLTPP